VTDPRFLTAREAARRIAEDELTAEALVTAYLDRIDARERVVGAWQYLDREAALAAARQRDAEPPRGPLHGIPIAVKDLIDTALMPTAYGSPIYRDHQPAADAACVALACAAGAIVLGKTVTTEFAAFTPGKTANPRNPAHTPGGSSSGSAAAVADGMAPLAFGTQTAGSVIRPAAYCGCVGYKPSFGLISRVGVKPLADSLDTVGILARTIEDAAFLAGVLSERPALRHLAAPAQAPRFGLYRTPMWDAAEPATAAALDMARAALEAFFGTCDAILVPAAPGEAPAGLGNTGDPVFNRMWTLLGVPCATLPARWAEHGLPTGVQLVGRVRDDARLMACAAFLERALAAAA
jgi:Asp-tRNA(Asn)/Glu-tRNA(Gln) amidotransferase A subunit family amidase